MKNVYKNSMRIKRDTPDEVIEIFSEILYNEVQKKIKHTLINYNDEGILHNMWIEKDNVVKDEFFNFKNAVIYQNTLIKSLEDDSIKYEVEKIIRIGFFKNGIVREIKSKSDE